MNTYYLDASVLVALFTDDALSGKADSLLRSMTAVVVVSDFAAAEFASAVAKKVRTGEMIGPEARAAFADFDAWRARSAALTETRTADITAAAGFLRRLDLSLRTPDAINIAIAQRLGAALATLDRRMANDAATLGVVAPQL